MGHRESMESGKFDELLRNATRRIFRMEALPEYNVPDDRAVCDQFLRGVPLPALNSPEFKEWDESIENYRKRGVRFERLRLLPETISPYLRYEIDWVYSYTAKAGEETRLCPQVNAHPTIRKDFYVLDDSQLIYIEYDTNAAWQGFSLELDSDCARELIGASSTLWKKATTLEDFLAVYRNRPVELQ